MSRTLALVFAVSVLIGSLAHAQSSYVISLNGNMNSSAPWFQNNATHFEFFPFISVKKDGQASNAFVTMLTSCIDSAIGTYAVFVGSHGYITDAPSTRVLFCKRETPFTLKETDLCGLPAAEFTSPAPLDTTLVPSSLTAPGTMVSRL